MIKDSHILWFAGNDWWAHNPSPEKHWAERFAKAGNKVFYVNSIGVGLPYLHAAGFEKRLIKKLKSLLRYIRQPIPNLWVFTPFVFPLWSIGFIARLNRLLLSIQINIFLRIHGFTNYIFWAGLPTPAEILDRFNSRSVIYYYQDTYTSYYEDLSFQSIHRNDDRLCKAANAVICASIGMYRELSKNRSNVFYIPHGIPDSFFQSDRTQYHDVPSDLSLVPKPIIGYWGSLEILQDQALIEYLADRHPDWSFVFIGQPLCDFSRLYKYNNIYFLGQKSLNEIPKYGIHFSLGIMAFVQNNWITYSCPVKYREYLALGLPIVSVPIIEVMEAFRGVARVESSYEKFSRACAEEIENDSIEKRISRRSLVKDYTWDVTADKVSEVIESCLN